MDGGRVAAYGYQYQYLRTLEQLVALLPEPQVDCVRVEGPSASEGAVDQVDFDVVDLDGSVRMAVQVKSRVAGGSMSGATALGILLAMVSGGQEARSYWLLTNARPAGRSGDLDEILSAGLEPPVLRRRLMELFHDATQRRKQLEELSDAGLAQLGRCRVAYDPRDDDEIREELRNALRGVRNRARQGLGEKSAGLLTGYLISEILARAADVTGGRAKFSVEELRRLVLVDGETLARSIGMRDWGTLVGRIPTIPDVERPALLAPLMAQFQDATGQAVRRVTFIGPSGIGKSSAAALYVSARADAYDFIGWIDCETEYSTRTSFQRVVTALDPGGLDAQHETPVEELQQEVQRVLSRLAGRWLLVCDNATSVRDVDSWTPKVGRGDVIVTTLNGANHPGGGEVVHVAAMERSQSVELLSRRLRLSDDERDYWGAALSNLAAGLGDWPLALELGAGYLYNCGYGLDYVDDYLQELRVRSVSDDDSVPPGYPQTLAAALNLSLDRLQARIRPQATAPDPPHVALQMLYGSAYLASHQIPAHLLLASAISDIDSHDPEHRGPFLVSPRVANLGEALRELNRFSLIKNDLPLPPTYGETLPGAERTIAVNTVTQALLRDRLNDHPELPNAMQQLVGHVERWLSSPVQLGELERVHVIKSHAEVLLAHIEQMGFSSERVALLYGNLAAPYYLQGDMARAEKLLVRELEHLARISPTNDVLVVQTRYSLANMYVLSQEADREVRAGLETSFEEAVRHLEFVLHQATAWAFDQSMAALKLAVDSRMLLQNADFSELEAQRITPLWPHLPTWRRGWNRPRTLWTMRSLSAWRGRLARVDMQKRSGTAASCWTAAFMARSKGRSADFSLRRWRGRPNGMRLSAKSGSGRRVLPLLACSAIPSSR